MRPPPDIRQMGKSSMFDRPNDKNALEATFEPKILRQGFDIVFARTNHKNAQEAN